MHRHYSGFRLAALHVDGLAGQPARNSSMGYKLEIAPAGSANWTTLAEQYSAASAINTNLTLTSLNPELFHNGVYTLRVSAWDLVGRATELNARVVIDTVLKTSAVQSATDRLYTLAGHQQPTHGTRTARTGIFRQTSGNYDRALQYLFSIERMKGTPRGVQAGHGFGCGGDKLSKHSNLDRPRRELGLH